MKNPNLISIKTERNILKEDKRKTFGLKKLFEPIIKKVCHFKDIYNEFEIENLSSNNISRYFEIIKAPIENEIKDIFTSSKSFPNNGIKFQLTLTVEYLKESTEKNIEFHFTNKYSLLLNLDEFEDIYSELTDYFINSIEEAQLRGSGFKFINIVKTRLKIIEINQLRGSSYIELPFKNKNILNIKNTNDNKCFMYSVLAHIHKVDSKDHPQRPIKYMKYEQELNMGGIEYPIKLKDIHKFEAQNPNINIYVFALPDKKKEKESK